MLRIERLRIDDIPGALRLSTAAGWNQLEADWRRLVELWPETCFAGWVGTELVASGTLAVYQASGGPIGWVGMILVDAAHQKRGYGGAILNEIIGQSQARGIATLGLDATDQGRAVYLKHGFVDHCAIQRWVKPSPALFAGLCSAASREIPVSQPVQQIPKQPTAGGASEALQATSLARAWIPADQDGLLALDAVAGGMDRAPLINRLAHEPGAFAAVLDRPANAAPIAGSGITAFGLSRRGRTASQIGPVVAESIRSATQIIASLLVYLAGAHPDQSTLIDVPQCIALDEFLTASGFQVSRRLVRMLRPGAKSPGELADDRAIAACGFELG